MPNKSPIVLKKLIGTLLLGGASEPITFKAEEVITDWAG